MGVFYTEQAFSAATSVFVVEKCFRFVALAFPQGRDYSKSRRPGLRAGSLDKNPKTNREIKKPTTT
jgi:hypothetical protein